MNKRIIVFFLVLFVSVSLFTSFVSSASAQSRHIPRVISVLYDDSGSMKTNDKEDYANYAMQTLCGLMDNSDRLFITYMNNKSASKEQILDGNRSDVINGIKSRSSSGGTPLSRLEKVTQDLINGSAGMKSAECYLIVFTDGAFTYDNGVIELPTNDVVNMFSEAQKKLRDSITADSSPEIIFLSIGDNLGSELLDLGISVDQVSDAKSISDKLIDIANKVTGRNNITAGNTTSVSGNKITVKLDYPVLSLALLTQSSTGSSSGDCSVSSVTCNGTPLDNFVSYKVEKESLSGSTSTVSPSSGEGFIPKGEIIITLADNSVSLSKDMISVLVEPAVEVTTSITKDGKEITSGEIRAGDALKIACSLHEMTNDGGVGAVVPDSVLKVDDYDVVLSDGTTTYPIEMNSSGVSEFIIPSECAGKEHKLTVTAFIKGYLPISAQKDLSLNIAGKIPDVIINKDTEFYGSGLTLTKKELVEGTDKRIECKLTDSSEENDAIQKALVIDTGIPEFKIEEYSVSGGILTVKIPIWTGSFEDIPVELPVNLTYGSSTVSVKLAVQQPKYRVSSDRDRMEFTLDTIRNNSEHFTFAVSADYSGDGNFGALCAKDLTADGLKVEIKGGGTFPHADTDNLFTLTPRYDENNPNGVSVTAVAAGETTISASIPQVDCEICEVVIFVTPLEYRIEVLDGGSFNIEVRNLRGNTNGVRFKIIRVDLNTALSLHDTESIPNLTLLANKGSNKEFIIRRDNSGVKQKRHRLLLEYSITDENGEGVITCYPEYLCATWPTENFWDWTSSFNIAFTRSVDITLEANEKTASAVINLERNAISIFIPFILLAILLFISYYIFCVISKVRFKKGVIKVYLVQTNLINGRLQYVVNCSTTKKIGKFCGFLKTLRPFAETRILVRGIEFRTQRLSKALILAQKGTEPLAIIRRERVNNICFEKAAFAPSAFEMLQSKRLDSLPSTTPLFQNPNERIEEIALSNCIAVVKSTIARNDYHFYIFVAQK